MVNEKILDELLKQVLKARDNDEIPVGALIIDKKGVIISAECNNRQNSYNVLGHAEINAILKAEDKIEDWRLDGYDLIVNLKPCAMCAAIIKESRLDNVYYFVDSNDNTNDFIQINDEKYDYYKKLFTKIIKDYFKDKR